MTEELPFCECGCGESVAKKGNRFIHGHNGRGVNNGMYGKHHTDEAKTKMAEKMSGKNNKMYGIRGGNDIVNHHYIYDHSDLSKYTMKVTRSKHAKIHAWMKKAGIKVPHINVKEENNDI